MNSLGLKHAVYPSYARYATTNGPKGPGRHRYVTYTASGAHGRSNHTNTDAGHHRNSIALIELF